MELVKRDLNELIHLRMMIGTHRCAAMRGAFRQPEKFRIIAQPRVLPTWDLWRQRH